MAQLIGGLATSHIPAIGGAIHKGLQQDPYWKPFFDGYGGAQTAAHLRPGLLGHWFQQINLRLALWFP